MENISKSFILNSLDGLSTTENSGSSQVFSVFNMIQAIKEELVLETGKPASDFNFGEMRVDCVKPLHLGKDTIPTMVYRMTFSDLGLSLVIDIKHYYDWYYYISAIEEEQKGIV